MARRNSEYWAKRSIERTTAAERNSVAYLKQIQRTYRDTAKSLVEDLRAMYAAYYRKDNTFDSAALHMIPTDGSLRKFRDDMRKAGLTTLLPENYQGRIDRLELLNAQAWLQVKKAAAREQLLSTKMYGEAVRESYRKTAFDVFKGASRGSTFADIDTRTVDKILETKFYGSNYSERIWANTDHLVKNIQEVISRAVATGQSYERSVREIQTIFNVKRSDAARLVRTETNYFQNRGELESYDELGVDKYIIIATLDDRTSEICRSMDGKIFDVAKAKPGTNTPPFHPYCRTTIAPYIGKEWKPTERIMRDPETGRNQIIDNMNYEEWKEKYLIPAQEKGKNEGQVKVIIGKTNPIATVWELTSKQKEAVEKYVSGDGMYINQYLRNGRIEDLSLEDNDYYLNLRQATNHELGEEMTLYRSVDASAIFGKMTNLQYENLVDYIVVGDRQRLVVQDAEMLLNYAKQRGVITEKGFMSTTKGKRLALDFKDFTGSDKPIVLELKAPSGTRGLDLSKKMPGLNKRMAQEEVLLTTRTEYQITGITSKEGQIYVKATIMPKELPVTEANWNTIPKTLSKTQYEQYDKLLSKHSAEKKLYDTYANRINIGSTTWNANKAHYSPLTNTVKFNLAKDIKPSLMDDAYRVLFHESGHNIDHLAVGLHSTQPFSLVYKDGLFPKTIKEEVKALVKERHDILKQANPSAPIMNAYVQLKQEIVASGAKTNHYLSDILSGATRNKILINSYHPTAYWRQGGESALATESFVQMYSATILNDEAAGLIKKYLPKSYKIYCDMIEEMVKRGKT